MIGDLDQPTLFQASRRPNSITTLKCCKSCGARYSYVPASSLPYYIVCLRCTSHLYVAAGLLSDDRVNIILDFREYKNRPLYR